MSNLYERINYYCKARDVTGGKMCSELGLSRGLMSDLKMGRKQTLNTETALKIANYLEITVEELFGEEKEKPAANKGNELTEDEIKFLSIMRQIPADKLDLAESLLRALHKTK